MGYTGEGPNLTQTSEEDTRFCRLANGDLDNDDDVSENPAERTPEDETASEEALRLKCRLQDYPTGRRTTLNT